MVKLEHIIDELIIWIDNNIHKSLKIEDVAQRSGYSKWHLQRVFYQVKNTNLANYIRDKKLEMAAYDLIQSDESILSISLKYGFDSQQSFTRSFAKKYHLPPSRFRRLNGKTDTAHAPI
ncbi:AraC family of transcriptional regulator, multidrug resistance transcriptional activator [Kosakonia arachidis]|uniref:AraC family of transcriptional regulator, multidrug resistance transcriptional activator n=1 Tax=Kosakonia arachidis TaxID=551989 RepID=A0A1I6Y4J8_9ENTR|nr:helix-turn-helix domain-containing protein [Kosakonia arachidis]SFT45585.1 AraC family of transcriptional regulator, multidrug resistance transcriptional activator [Kosakonia arachidis]